MEPVIHGDAGAEFNAFIGRERELGELRAIAAGTRALTLCGAGGIGKTRLATHLVADLSPGYADGAWLVELAELRQPDLVASKIASVIGVTEEPGRPLLATLADALRSRQMLLCLDNCEHLIDACAQLCQRLLASSPGLRVIATSREPLRIAAETVWQVPPLSLTAPRVGGTGGSAGPAGSAGADAAGPAGADAAGSDALRLFADRAAAAKPGFALGPANVVAITQICESLDGLPLAIELAAAWVRVLTVEQIAARLADRFKLLSFADRTVPARHRTLRAAIDWSHDLLSAPERVLLRRLSAFASWTLEMAEELCAGGDDIAAAGIVDLLTALADKSLVMAEYDAQGKFRYRMLDTIRQYAAARLNEAGESAIMHDRFRDYAVRETEELALVGMARVSATWAARVETIHRFEVDNANLRQVLGRALVRGDVAAGLRICVSMRPVWIIQGASAEGIRWMDSFLALDRTELPDDVLGAALVGRAQLTMASDPDAASRYATDGLALCQDEGSAFWAASALNLLAEAALHAGRLDEAQARANEAIATAKRAGERFNEAYACGTLAAVAAMRGDLGVAKELAEQALEISYDIDQQWGAARALMGLGDLARLTEQFDQATRHYTEALGILSEINANPEIARCLAGLGRVALRRGDLAGARRFLGDSLGLSRLTGSRIGVIRGLDSFAELTTDEGNLPVAVQLTAAAAALRRAACLPVAPASRRERVMAAAAGLGEEVIGELWAAGSALSGDAAVSLALGDQAQRISEPAAPGQDAATPAAPAAPGGSSADGSQPGEPPAWAGQPGGLTTREREIVSLIATGSSNRAIAEALVITPATAARHVANIMSKLGLNSRAQIAAWALTQQNAGQGDTERVQRRPGLEQGWSARAERP
jgi:predicted ATPase/DNA-binding CsgD family transcriptional regulator